MKEVSDIVISESDADEHKTPEKKQKLVKRKIDKTKNFQNSWLQNVEFKDWLLEVKDDKTKAYCKACKSQINCGTTELKRHNNGEKHKVNLNNMLRTPSASSFFVNTNHDKQVKSTEVKLAAFIADNNISIKIIDSLVTVLKNIFPDSKIAKEINLGRTKCSKIITNVLCKVENDNLNDVLKQTKFSIFVDESTDISNAKNLCVLVRYVVHNKVNTQLLQLITINATDCSATALFNQFKNCLLKRGIPLQNIIGMASDTASVMIGCNNSFFTILQQEISHPIVLLKCICHSSSLVLKFAIEFLPRDCELFLRDIGTYISESPKSAAVLTEFQDYFNVSKSKIISPAATRWLSMHPCILNILTNWNVLMHFFIYENSYTKRKKAANILQHFQNPEIKAYLLFLKKHS